MGREIKFRAWDGKRMILSHNLMLDCFDGRAYWQFGYQQPEPMGADVVIMQLTGRKDKDGAGIFEGDIIREHFNNQIYEIRENGSYFTAEGRGYRYPLHSLLYPIEVIGNIHQNPELLEAKP